MLADNGGDAFLPVVLAHFHTIGSNGGNNRGRTWFDVEKRAYFAVRWCKSRLEVFALLEASGRRAPSSFSRKHKMLHLQVTAYAQHTHYMYVLESRRLRIVSLLSLQFVNSHCQQHAAHILDATLDIRLVARIVTVVIATLSVLRDRSYSIGSCFDNISNNTVECCF